MVKKCRGLPLAVVVLGGLLATKKSLKEWEVVHGSINAQFVKWEQHHQYGGVYGILALSYHDLPFHLKPCFLYLSQFPEDWEFKKRELIRMWIAEGFILQSSIGGEETMEDVGEEYLEELVSRCVVQVSQRDHTGIGVKRCRIHDLVRDMCISKARDENFLGVMQHTEDAVTTAVHPSAVDINEDGMRRFYMTRQQGRFIFENFRLLRVLKIDNIWQSRLPTEIGHLIHLRPSRSLKMRMQMRMESFPNLEPLSSLHRLTKLELRGAIPEDPHSLHHNLEYLPASLAKLTLIHSQLKRDPMGILEKLPNLRFLYFDYDSYVGSQMFCSARGFPQLETLILKFLEELEEWEIKKVQCHVSRLYD
ncbi:hypothetical protein GH714_011826 [Hevea brasiliensis]|uniref:Disease resistance protein winged helix domain-containing protein n=1 Tax=Hevea brasiliensis TaxID=3981 RepID=A0A6A6N0K1_HEVBR|nr:hypothetical protein GH714_011826 [Hevea brasiliensis]